VAKSRSRSGFVVGLAAAIGAFGAAAMVSTASAPAARADDFSDIISAVDGDFTAGQTAFTIANSEFGSSEPVAGLAAFFGGVNDDALSAPNNLLVGSVEALTNETVTGSEPFGFLAPSSFSDALAAAESIFTIGESYFTVGATDFAGGDYGAAALYDLFGSDYVSVLPLEDLILGAAVSF
jgi:hypothetical protein